MNEIKIKVNFGKRTCVKSGISLTTGDYNSTKIIFEFDREDGKKIFEMKNPNNEIIFVDEIINNEVILVGQADITTKHNDVIYIKYTDDNETIYWYDSELDKLYDTSFVEVQNVSIDNLTKLTENASLFTMAGRYTFEISLYDGESKLTSKSDYLDVKEEQVVINDNMVSLYLPVFDRLIGELDNLDIDVSKSGSTTTVVLTKKNGTTKSVNILDGSGSGGGTTEYEELNHLPSINNIELKGNKSSADLGLQPAGNYLTEESDPTVPNHVKNITQANITSWDNKSNFSGDYNDLSNKPTIPDVSNFITKNVNDLTYYYTKTEVDNKISSVYKYKGTVATYNNLPTQNLTIGDVYNVETDGSNYAWTGTVWDKLGGDIDLSGYQTKIDSSHKLSSDLVDDTNGTNKFTTAQEKNTWNGKYNKPVNGIPKTDLASGVQTSLDKADTALQSYTEQYTGTITGITMNGISKGTSGVVDLGTVITSHQDISGKQNITDNTLTTNNKTVPSAINEVNSIARGANQALSYSSYQSMISVFNSLSNAVYNIGQNVMIITLEVPDLWISDIESTSSAYTYIDDETFVNELKTNGYVQVGYYKLSALETQKVDLTDYVKNTNYANANVGGVIKTSNVYGHSVTSNGQLFALTKTHEEYNSSVNALFISKGTLENVITGKNLVSSSALSTVATSGSYNDLSNKPTIQDCFIVSITVNGGVITASHSPSEIKAAVDSGKVAYLKQSYYMTGGEQVVNLYPIGYVSSTQAIISTSGHDIENPNDNPLISTMIIDSQKNITFYDNSLITSHQDISGKQNITDNTLTTNNKTIPTAINEVNSIARGANQAISFSNYQQMVSGFNILSSDMLKIGQNVMIVTLNVPDLWISGIESTSSTYTYTSDSDFTNALATNGYVQVGYYRLSALETQKVDLTGYARAQDIPTNLSDLNDNSTHRLVTDAEKNTWNSKANISDIPDTSSFITNTVNNLTNYYTKTAIDTVLNNYINEVASLVGGDA